MTISISIALGSAIALHKKYKLLCQRNTIACTLPNGNGIKFSRWYLPQAILQLKRM